MDVIQQTLEYLAAGKQRNVAISQLKIAVEIKRDPHGIIIDPLDTDYKCGWGSTLQEAIWHCAERNNIDL